MREVSLPSDAPATRSGVQKYFSLEALQLEKQTFAEWNYILFFLGQKHYTLLVVNASG